MIRIHLVRHGKAEAGFDGHPDPGLDPLGHTQAAFAADRLAHLDPVAIVSSPLARARETAAPLARAWDAAVAVEPRVAEIPSPTEDLAERTRWLREAMQGTWADLGDPWVSWRDALVAWAGDREEDAVVFSHFVAINALVGHARGRDELVVFRPDHCSITTLAVEDGGLAVETLGDEADTRVR